MGRKIPADAAFPTSSPQVNDNEHLLDRVNGSALETLNLAIELITPMFGGGYTAGEVNDSNPVNGKSIRGHLRFWWRATRGARFDDVAQMLEEENRIWGSSEKTSTILIRVKLVDNGRQLDWIDYKLKPNGSYSPDFKGWPAYALFPFQGKPPNRRNKLVQPGDLPNSAREGVKFDLSLHFPALLSQDVFAATWAWTNFGGIGARTRRGCGAIWCSRLAPPDDDISSIKDWFKRSIKQYEVETKHVRSWCTLYKRLLIANNSGNTVGDWRFGIELLREFRQEVGLGRNKSIRGKPAGRSRWPEADSIRSITGDGDPQHMKSNTLDFANEEIAFPRAEFGLPIIYHFMGLDETNSCELYPKKAERMASQLLIRPLKPRSGRSRLILMVLSHDPVKELEIRKLSSRIRPSIPSSLPISAKHVSRGSLAKYGGSPLRYATSGSALEAFLEYVRRPSDEHKGFSEI